MAVVAGPQCTTRRCRMASLSPIRKLTHDTDMADTRTPAQRSAIMRAVGNKNTKPEIAVRQLAQRLGFRFRLHVKKWPGKPDIVFPHSSKIVLVHGCFWHGHRCRYGKLPKSRLEFWGPKIAANRVRDNRTLNSLRGMGWSVLVVWQCQTKDLEKLEKRIAAFLDRKSDRHSRAKRVS